MIINNSTISLGSSHSKQQTHSEYASLETYKIVADGSLAAAKNETSDNTTLSDKALTLAKGIAASDGNLNINHSRTDHLSSCYEN